MRDKGFTLLELVIALGVFAVIGLISAQLLTHSINVTETILDRSGRLIEVQRALQTIQRDLSQHRGTSIRNQFGDREESIELRSSVELEFTRAGWSNPLGRKRSNLQRVAYLLEEGRLIRRFWHVLNRPNELEHQDQVLLTSVTSVRFNVITEDGQRQIQWPPRAGGDILDAQSVIAVSFVGKVDGYDEFNMLVNIPEEPHYIPAHRGDERSET
ncbi:MAG: type II secretion system minor pseudopilin GspJ [Gammaproteobacteria bacterium]|nr:type II secretion system minor pseudopilin GspJ [Gammaproteobacteria bacterium]